MKLKKEYVILFLIIAVLVLYISLRKDSRIQYEIPEITELSQDSISGIVIKGSEGEVLLAKENNKWFIGADKYAADTYKVEKMISFLKKPVLMTVVSDSKDYMRYGLDDKTRITVTALSGENPERLVEIGYQADVQNSTFIKLENDHRVYHARDDLRDIFSTNIDDIRDKAVLSFDTDKVGFVQISKDGKEFDFNKKETSSGEEDKSTAFQWEAGDGKIVDATLMNSLLDDMLKIKCSEYIYKAEEGETGNPVYVIRVNDGNEHVLTVFPKKEDDYRAESSDNPTPFSLYSWRIDNIIEKFDKMSGEKEMKEPESD